jgi:hypothetical protein
MVPRRVHCRCCRRAGKAPGVIVTPFPASNEALRHVSGHDGRGAPASRSEGDITMERERPDRTPWTDSDRRMLLITVAGGLAANLATLVVVFGGIALIKHVQHCVRYYPPDNNGCQPGGWAPVWPLVWLITLGGGLAVGLILAARRVHRRVPAPRHISMPPAPLWPVMSPMPRPGKSNEPISRKAAEWVRPSARAVQWVAGLYILGVAIMWVGVASGYRPP